MLGFTPSNLSLFGVDVCGVEDVVITTDGCSFDTLDGTQTCTTMNVKQVILGQSGGAPDIAVWIAKSWYIGPGVQVTITPSRPVAFVALDTIDIEGTLSVSASGFAPTAGGTAYATPGQPNHAGSATPSGGGAGSGSNAAGGGGFCGKGGAGAAWSTGVAAAGGAVTGNAQIIPLVGGSPGGAGVGYPGAGGGALQLVAALSVTVGVNGAVTANGGEGGNAASAGMGDGGGSGGAILIEATTVNTPGSIFANGGNGGNGGNGLLGGFGSTGSTAAGSAGSCPAGSCFPTGAAASAGGGGAGWVRINTRMMSALGGIHSPDLNSGCYSLGTVRP